MLLFTRIRGVAQPQRAGLLRIAVKVLGDETLRGIARELVASVRANVTLDWTGRGNVRAQLRVLVKRIPAPVRIPARQTGAGRVAVGGMGSGVG